MSEVGEKIIEGLQELTEGLENEDHVRDLHTACKLMGWTVVSGDRFVRQAIEFLAKTHVEIVGDDEMGWNVKGVDFCAGGDTLVEALVAAIFCVNDPKPKE